ncbi:hypothetical protein ACRAWF_21910 [Streptomyces sp. L7]
MADATSAFNAAISSTAGPGGTVVDPAGHLQHPRPHQRQQRHDRRRRHVVLDGHRHGPRLLRQRSAPNASTGVRLQNFAIFGNVQERDDSAQVNGIGGAMSSSTVSSSVDPTT